MKKAIRILCLLAMAAMMAVGFAACDQSGNGDQSQGDQNNTNDQTPSDEKQTFTGISFEDRTVTYDGSEHSLTIEGELPENAQVVYENNTATNAGTYQATATLSAENYQTLELSATLTIEKATFTGITFEGDTVIYDGKAHSLAISSEAELPAGTTVTYRNNDQTEGGEYTVTAIVSNPNYETLELTATLYIRTLADAKDIIDNLLSRPDAWSFLPEAFLPENMAYDRMPVSDFTTAVDVSTIGKRSIGKQLNVVYDIMNTMQTVLSATDTVFMAGEAIAAVYQTFINDNPDSYNEFTGSVAIGDVTFSMKVALQDQASVLLLGNNTVNIELRADSASNLNSGRIQLTDGAVLKYEATDSSLKLAINAEISAVQVAQMLEFVRSEDSVTGYLHEYYGVGSAAIKTTALITSNEDYTIVTGNKRESDDLLIEAYEEVYDSRTGNYIGAEVAETVKAVDYDTLWFPLDDVQGFSTVRAVEDPDATPLVGNSHLVYVNGSSDVFETKNIGGLGLDMLSRRFDIEMKEVWYVVAEQDGEEITYSTQKTLIPMLFVQKQSLSDFAEDVTEKNDSVTNAALPATSPITTPFTASKETYLALKELITYEQIQSFIGEKDPFFSDTAQ